MKQTEPYTPGPWFWDESDLYPEGPRQAYSEALEAAIDDEDSVYPDWVEPIVQTDGGAYGPRGGDRALIAAAPDLLEAAKHVVMEWRLHGALTDSCRVLERAIAKAEGEESR